MRQFTFKCEVINLLQYTFNILGKPNLQIRSSQASFPRCSSECCKIWMHLAALICLEVSPPLPFCNLTFSPHPLGFLAGVLAQSGHGFFWNFLPPARSLLCGFPPKHMACVPEGDGTACGSRQTWAGQLRPLSQGHKQQTRAWGTFSLSNLFYIQIFPRSSIVEWREKEQKTGKTCGQTGHPSFLTLYPSTVSQVQARTFPLAIAVLSELTWEKYDRNTQVC